MNKIKTWLKVLPLVGLALFALVVAVRLFISQAQVQSDRDALAGAAPLAIGETQTLEILPLYEGATSHPGLHSGLGVSYLVKTDTATILLDLGNNPTDTSLSPLEQNMAALGISLDEVDLIVISHTHYDHTGGPKWQKQGSFSIGGDRQTPLGDRPIYVPESLTYPGSAPIVVREPRKIAEGVAVTGAIPFQYPFPAWLAIPGGVEQALIVNVKGLGAVVITGCGHMGLDSLLAHSQAQIAAPVAGIVGGLHKGNADAQALRPDIQLLDKLHPVIVAISPHDTRAAGLAAFREAFPVAYRPIAVGTALCCAAQERGHCPPGQRAG